MKNETPQLIEQIYQLDQIITTVTKLNNHMNRRIKINTTKSKLKYYLSNLESDYLPF